jgi:hypothetical protein
VTSYIEDLGLAPPEEFRDDDPEEEVVLPEEEQLDPEEAGFLDELVKRIILFCEELAGFELRPYQRQFGYRVVESIVLNDAEEITGLMSRQGGKSEVLADVMAGCMVILPILSRTFEILGRFKDGFWVGVFAPVDDQAEVLYGRIVSRLSSEHATDMLLDPEVDERPDAKSRIIRLRNGSFCRRQTANPRAKIEGTSYHILVIDESQACDEQVIRRSVHPMGAAYASTIVKIGTPNYHKGDFYKAINLNKRRATRKGRQNHFEFDWKIVAKYNDAYRRFVEKEKIRLGEDSDEYQMSYCLKWPLDKGMLITEDELDALADPSMQIVKSWWRSPVVVGIDPARVKDSTVVTVCWVDWDYPDPAGYREHRILNWLEIQGTAWEEQYFQIMEFLDSYNLAYVGVDAHGMGSAVADRLERLLGNRCDVLPMHSDSKNQADRWKHLIALLQRRMLVYPGHSKARRTRAWRKFRQQMADAEKVMKGQYLLIQAPEERYAYDDYVDSLAIAAACSLNDTVPMVEVMHSPFYRGA